MTTQIEEQRQTRQHSTGTPKLKSPQDKLFNILSNRDTRFILNLMRNDTVLTYSQMLNIFARSFDISEGERKKKSGLFAYNIKRLASTKLISKDTSSKFYFITLAGMSALKGAKIIEKALDERTINDVNKQGKLVFKVYREE